jgi:hypothetical protein
VGCFNLHVQRSGTRSVLLNLCALKPCLSSQDRRRQERGKKQAKEDTWRDKYNKEERKKKYIVQGQTEKRKALQAQGKFASRKKSKTGARDD